MPKKFYEIDPKNSKNRCRVFGGARDELNSKSRSTFRETAPTPPRPPPESRFFSSPKRTFRLRVKDGGQLV